MSTINVYADTQTPGQTVDAPLVEPVLDGATERSPEVYGGVKVASENAVRSARVPAFVIRAGLLVGPGDTEDRFGYWAARMARGGRVLVPGDAGEVPATWMDVRDLATWMVGSAEQGRAGTFDGSGPAVPLRDVLAQPTGALAPVGTELVAVPAPVLHEAGVAPWSGAKSLPLWLPPTHYGLVSHDVNAALQAGLTSAEEAELLAAWQADSLTPGDSRLSLGRR